MKIALYHYNTFFLHILLYRQRAYFEDIRILVPESWSDSDSYTPVQDERYDISDIRIDLPSEDYGDKPYTNKPTPCGEPGLYIHLTPSFLEDESIARAYGGYDKVCTDYESLSFFPYLLSFLLAPFISFVIHAFMHCIHTFIP